MQSVLFRDLGEMDYLTAWNYQEALLQENVGIKMAHRKQLLPMDAQPELAISHNQILSPAVGQTPTVNYLLFLEHPPVYTLGKSGLPENMLITEQEMTQKGIDFFKTNRGGDITFHGPGQLVGYPILDLEKFYTDIGKYLRDLEEVIIRTISEYGLKGERSPGETGVWLEPSIKGGARKICAMGIRCSRWITMHGFALNVNTDLGYFDNIIPCGIRHKQVTSLQKELRSTVPMEEVKQKVKRNFEEVFLASIYQDL